MTEVSLEDIHRQVYRGDIAGGLAALRALLAADQQLDNVPDFNALLAFALLRDGRLDEGRARLDAAWSSPPRTAAGLADLGASFFLLGRMRRAQDFLRRSVDIDGGAAVSRGRLGLVLMARGEMAEAEKNLLKALELDPEHPTHHYSLASLCTHLGRFSEALSQVRRALELEPAMDEALALRNQLLVGLDQAAELIEELETKLEAEPDSVALKIMLAELLEADGRFPEARSLLEAAIAREPENLELALQLAGLFLARQLNQPAVKLLAKTRELFPDSRRVLFQLTRALSEAGRSEDAAEVAGELLDKNPDDFRSFQARAQVRMAADDPAGAEADLRQAMELRPGAVELHSILGHLLMQNGRLDEAVVEYKRAAALNPTALAGLIEARAFPEDPGVVERMRQLADSPMMQRGPRASLSFALARLFDKGAEYDLAFKYAEQANHLTSKAIVHRKNRHAVMVKVLERYFTKDYHERFRAVGSRSARPVFVVGMPRSGTTLTEQILCTHPEVFGAGELGYIGNIIRLMPKVTGSARPYPFCLGGLRRWMPAHAASNYLKKIARLDPRARRVVDKMPHNFMHLGLINLIFPRARIIHVQRDFRDVAISNYFTNFKHKHGGMSYAFDLANIGRMINDYRRIMDHWRQILPPGAMFEFHYEELVENPEEIGRRLLEFIGLEWHDRLLEFHRTERAVKTASVWQVRQPLYRSSKERWRHYEPYLGVLVEVLGEYPPRFG